MSQHSRLPLTGSSALDERIRQSHTPSSASQETYKLAGGHRDEIYSNGNSNVNGHGRSTTDAPKHRRGVSASEMPLKRLREGQPLETQEPIPELFLGAPLEDMYEAERRTWQTQWTDALKRVQTLRHSGPQSERWSGVATDIYRPKSFAAQDSSGARTSRVPAGSLDHWNYYPGPSRNRENPPSQQDNKTLEYKSAAAAWNGSLLGGAKSSMEGKSNGRDTTATLVQGRGAKSVTTFERREPPLLENSVSGDNMVATQRRDFSDHRGVPSLDRFSEFPLVKNSSAVGSQVQRTQSHRYGRIWGQKPEGNHVREVSDGTSGAAFPTPVLKKAISMREGGAHADSVMEMGRAYTDTVCGVAKTLECASCGRNLGIIVQGNPGVDIAFCQACRPSPLQWKKPASEVTTGAKKKKTNGIVRFCRKILRLDKRSS